MWPIQLSIANDAQYRIFHNVLRMQLKEKADRRPKPKLHNHLAIH